MIRTDTWTDTRICIQSLPGVAQQPGWKALCRDAGRSLLFRISSVGVDFCQRSAKASPLVPARNGDLLRHRERYWNLLTNKAGLTLAYLYFSVSIKSSN